MQAFTAIGEIAEGEPQPFDMGGGFVPFRWAARFYTSFDAPIESLLPLLSFTRGRRNWSVVFRRGVFAIDKADCESIAKAMRAAPVVRLLESIQSTATAGIHAQRWVGR